jgi:Ser/Thr protein kinase RdoA (MazF antagonist)
MIPLGNHGGFSGAQIWRIESEVGPACLRAWPPGKASKEFLRDIHDLMKRAAGLRFVPAVHARSDGTSYTQHAGRWWDLTSWQPGTADFHARPSPQRLRAACIALGQLHALWTPEPVAVRSCPAIRRRLARTREWLELLATGWREPLQAPAGDPAGPVAQRVWKLVAQTIHRLPRQLASWQAFAVPVQPCLCDVWHDHLLFDCDMLTGLIDYGGVKTDHVAVDLARMLGSLVGDDTERWAEGLAAYRGVREFSGEEESLARVLDQTGTILGAVNWLLWLYRDRREFEDRAGAARRLETLAERMEKWESRRPLLAEPGA